MNEQLSFILSAPGIESVRNGGLNVGDLIWKNMGNGRQLWLVISITDGKCFVQEPTIWDEMFADIVGW